MRITGLGHASVLIETAHGTVLTDPWVNPAYFGSWFPFPDNSQLDWDRIGQVDYLFVSHLHRDHFDARHLRDHIAKTATVLLPSFPTSELEDELRECGFTTFTCPPNEEVVDLDGLQVMVQSLISPTDGPIGDSALWLSDGDHIVYNQNDARPANLDAIRELGPVDGYLLQFSGAIWYPMVYDIPEEQKRAEGIIKRERQLDRSLRYIDEMEARWVFPTAGPPCFLDEELFHLNDLDGDEANIFPDQTVYIDWLVEQGHDEARLLLPGSVADLSGADCVVDHPWDPDTVFGSPEAKTAYLRDMQQRRMPEIDALRPTWREPSIDLIPEMAAWFEPLMAETDKIGPAIRRARLIGQDAERGDVDIVVDFLDRQVRPYDGEVVRYTFTTQRGYLERLVADREVDWSNSLFLSCRFITHRKGKYNEHLYMFFKCLSEERINYAEGWLVEQDAQEAAETVEIDGWEVQRRCPHLKADLARFGSVDGDIFTCQLHGWNWRLEDGQCLTSDGHPLRCAPVGSAVEVPAVAAVPHDDHRGQHDEEVAPPA